MLAAALVAVHAAPLALRSRAPGRWLTLVSSAFFGCPAPGYRPPFATVALYRIGSALPAD